VTASQQLGLILVLVVFLIYLVVRLH